MINDKFIENIEIRIDFDISKMMHQFQIVKLLETCIEPYQTVSEI